MQIIEHQLKVYYHTIVELVTATSPTVFVDLKLKPITKCLKYNNNNTHM